MRGISDTTPEAEMVLREVLQRIPFALRWRQMGEMYRLGRVFHAAGYRNRHHEATEVEIAADWQRMMLPAEAILAGQVGAMPSPEEPLVILEEVIAALERLDIVHALSGSWASCLQGERRFTRDADFSVEPFLGRESALAAAFGKNYCVRFRDVEEAVRQRCSFKIIHLPTSFKVNVFVRSDRLFETVSLERRRLHRYSEPAGPAIFILTPEDIILYKLEWFRIGGEKSECQWNDILGVLKVQAEKLDLTYLDRWAKQLGVLNLLQQAQHESKP